MEDKVVFNTGQGPWFAEVIANVHGQDVPERRLEDSEKCFVIAGTFAVFVQVFLAISAVVALVWKRHGEEPKRDLTIWFMDTSKQGCSLFMQHLVNIFLAIVFAQGETKASECIWYGANFAIATICGIFLLTMYMRLHRWAVDRFDLYWLHSGKYGHPGDPPNWRWWLAQMCVWVFVTCGEKFITAAVVIMPLHDTIDGLIAGFEMPMKPFPKFELVLNMVIMPAVLNVVFVWVVDNLIMDSDLKRELHGGIGDNSEEDEFG